MKKINFKIGFTLVELVLYIGIASAIAFVTTALLFTILGARTKNQVVIDVDQEGQRTMQIITQTIRNTTTINSPTAGLTAASLSLNTPTAANNPTVFDLSAGSIRIKEGAATVVPLTSIHTTASGLQFLNLTRPGTKGTIRIQFTLTYNSTSNRFEYKYAKQFTGSATLR